jgi:hypothetical protein
MMILFCIETRTRFFNKGTSLKEIMSRSDCYDRSYFTTEELADGLKKLLEVKFIEIKNNKIYPTDIYRKEKRIVSKKTNNISNEWVELEKLLDTYNDVEVDFLPKLPPDFITDESIENAINDYLYK